MPATISKGTLVHLVYVNPADKKRSWFAGTDRREDPKTKAITLWPLVDDDNHNSKPMTYEIAVVACRRFRDELNVSFRLALDAGATSSFIDEDVAESSDRPWGHNDYLVTVDADGKPNDDFDSPYVYRVKAVRTVQHGRAFVWRSDDGRLVNQPQFSSFDEGPEACVQKAFEHGFTKIERPKANPTLAAREAERQRQVQSEANASRGRIRPGNL